MGHHRLALRRGEHWFRRPISPREGMRTMCWMSPLASMTWSTLRIITSSLPAGWPPVLDHEVFERFVTGLFDLFVNDPRLADLELVALAAHGFDEDGQVQDTASEDGPLVLAVGGLDAQREVLLQFLVEAFADVPAGQVFPILAQKGRGVDGEQQTHGGLVHGDVSMASGCSRSDRVSPISKSSMPVMAQRSPDRT